MLVILLQGCHPEQGRPADSEVNVVGSIFQLGLGIVENYTKLPENCCLSRYLKSYKLSSGGINGMSR